MIWPIVQLTTCRIQLMINDPINPIVGPINDIPINEIGISFPLSPQKWPKWVFVLKGCAMFWNIWKNIFPIFTIFHFFEIWSILYSKYFGKFRRKKTPWIANVFIFLPKKYAMFWNVCKFNFQIFAT